MELFDGRMSSFRLTDGPKTSTFMGFGKTFKTVTSLGVSPKRMRKFRRKLRITGKQIKRRVGLTGVSSAAGVNSDSIYGPTGSIVGRY